MKNGHLPTAEGTRRESKHLVIVCQSGSDAEREADTLSQAAERTFSALAHELRVPGAVFTRPTKIVIRAGDSIEDPEWPGEGRGAGTLSNLATYTVSTVWRSDSQAEGLAEHLARVMLARVAAAAPVGNHRSDAQIGGAEVQRFFVEGVARYLAHKIERHGEKIAEETLAAERRCHDEAALNKWRLPLYQSIVRGSAEVDQELYVAMQVAFGGYLFERDGAKEFMRFLAGARNEPNYSAEIVYGKSLELLESEWIFGLRQGVGRRLVSLWKFLKNVWPYIRPYPWRSIEALALMIISSVAVQVTPFQFRNLIDLLVSPVAANDPWGEGLNRFLWIVLITTIATFTAVCAVARLIFVVNVLGQNILRDLRVAYIDRVNGLGAGYFARMRSGDLLARFISDMARLADPLAKTVAYSLYYIILMSVTFVSLIIMSWQLTIVLLIIVPTYLVISRWLGPSIQRAHRGRQERIAQINGHIQEMIFAHAMIQIFNLQNHVRRRMYPEIHEFRRVEIRSDFLRAIFEEVSDLGDLFSTKLVLICGGILALAAYDPAVSAVIGSITVGTLIGFNALMGKFVQPIHRLAAIYGSVAYASAALRRIEEILTQEPEQMGVPANGTAEPPAVREGITIENIDFAYGIDPVLQDVSVTIPAGTTAAFVGPTGAGKTTLVNMIPRFYDPAAGSVKIDGRDVREYALPALRSRIALVSQENFLFNSTIRENIAMGKLGATDEEVEEAARAAQIHDFIMSLPAGYDTIIGERGSRLSGGQRQRVAIARALLRNAPILILDEATSALDAETEAEILDELAQATKGKTTISITHRLALAMRADKIYVLDKGRIVESGTHDELLAKGGLYRKLFEDQNEYLVSAGLIGSKPADGAATNGATTESPAMAEPTA